MCETTPERRREVRIVYQDIGTRDEKGLAEGLIVAALCHPMVLISSELIDTMLSAISHEGDCSTIHRGVPLEESV